ncbi:ATP-binding protein [Halobellus salinisoli]|uniref:ATP-binding protein n=1 Tax=Halobellus salinisoli TaxID=3108500 RepID=UPI00300B3EEF
MITALVGGGSLIIGIVFANSYLIGLGALATICSLGFHLITSGSPEQGENTMDPEFVRERTSQWSDQDLDSSARQRLQPHLAQQARVQSKPNQPSDGNGSKQDQTQTRDATSLDSSELQYRWETDIDVSFEDVGGMGDVKQELRRDVIKPLTTHREQAEQLGISASNIVFHGPPGTGKSYLAQALASELGFRFTQLSGADVQSKWINASGQKVQRLFDEAKQIAADEGGAVIFLDELDSVLKSRDTRSAHEEDSKVVNEFLRHLETTSEHNIVFIGATNRLNALDQAGTRSGRLDKKIHIGLPDHQGRKDILRAQLADRPNSLSADHLEQVAGWTPERSAADLEQLVDNAARSSLDRGDDQITWVDIRRVISP